MALAFQVSLVAQNQSKADSLEQIFLDVPNPETELSLLKQLCIEQMDSEKKLTYSLELIHLAKANDSLHYLFGGYQELGNAYLNKGELSTALENYVLAAEYADQKESQRDLALNYQSIGNVYASKKDFRKAIELYEKSISVVENIKDFEHKDSLRFAQSLENLGFSYVKIQQPDSALLYLERSGAFFEALKNSQGIAYNLGNKGLAYVEMGEPKKAIAYLEEGIQILQELEDYYGISALLKDMSQLYMDLGDYEQAAVYARRSLGMARDQGLKEVISDANLSLSKIYEMTGDSAASYKYFKEYINYRDSILDVTSVEKMADMRTDFEVSQKQLEVDLLNNQKRTQRIIMYSLGFFLLLSFIYYRRLSKEKSRSDLLLLNILPSRTAKELKEKGKVEARKFKAVTVMFTDFQAFTRHSQNLSPEKLVKSVDHFFSAFDRIIEKYGLEKIKTIGDAYMCTGGLISKGPMQPIKVIHAAFEILDFMKKESESDNDDIAHFDVRIGINTGPVVAGVVGTKKFAYDIWGDTVNVAARMETNSQAGMINISENTYQLVKDRFECEYRGEIDVKNKGMMKMYFVLRPQKILNNKETEAAEMEEISSAPRTP